MTPSAAPGRGNFNNGCVYQVTIGAQDDPNPAVHLDTNFRSCGSVAVCSDPNVWENLGRASRVLGRAASIMLVATILQGIGIALAAGLHLVYEALFGGRIAARAPLRWLGHLKNALNLTAALLFIGTGTYLMVAPAAGGGTLHDWSAQFTVSDCFDAAGVSSVTSGDGVFINAPRIIVIGFIVLFENTMEEAISRITERVVQQRLR